MATARQPNCGPTKLPEKPSLIGRPAIRQVIYDPLLPQEMIDSAARALASESVRRFDTAGRTLWSEFFRFSDAPGPRAVNTPRSPIVFSHCQ